MTLTGTLDELTAMGYAGPVVIDWEELRGQAMRRESSEDWASMAESWPTLIDGPAAVHTADYAAAREAQEAMA